LAASEMLDTGRRVAAIAYNTYREAVRARILFGLAALALATALYSIAVGEFALKNASRVVADLGAASISFYAVLVAVIIGATSLYRELEQKTIFPILARPIHRAEYIVGKYAGTLLTLGVFIALDAGAVLLILARHGGRGFGTIGMAAVSLSAIPALVAWRVPSARTWLPIPWAAVALVIGAILASGAADDRRVVLGASTLAFLEVMIVSAIATLFASFSSPFLSAVFTVGFFLIFREAGTLSHLPARVFGETIKSLAAGASRFLPHLEVYVPPRPLLTGEVPGSSLLSHVGFAALQSIGWGLGLLVVSSAIFKRRDLL
jgi:hypothetical protein